MTAVYSMQTKNASFVPYDYQKMKYSLTLLVSCLLFLCIFCCLIISTNL